MRRVVKYSPRKAKYKLDFRSPRSDSTRIRERGGACEIMGAAYLGKHQGDVLRRGAPHAVSEVAMTLNALQISAIALSAAALVSSAPLSPASAATVVHHPAHAVHSRVAHGDGQRRRRSHCLSLWLRPLLFWAVGIRVLPGR